MDVFFRVPRINLRNVVDGSLDDLSASTCFLPELPKSIPSSRTPPSSCSQNQLRLGGHCDLVGIYPGPARQAGVETSCLPCFGLAPFISTTEFQKSMPYSTGGYYYGLT
jgi:hypothetical protein